MTQTLSRQDEQKLIQAVKEAVDLVDNESLTPDQALEKVARAQKWGKEMVKFASYAYNTGRQEAQRTSSTNILSKLAEFPIADPDNIIEKIWPANVKAAAEAERLSGVSDEYDAPPAWPTTTGHVKAASDDDDFKLVDKPPDPYAPDPTVKMAKVYNAHRMQERVVEEARHKEAMANEAMIGAMGRLAAHFKHQPAGIDQAFQVAEIYDYGTKSALDKLYKFVAQRNNLGKIVTAEDGGLRRELQDRQAADVSQLTVDHAAAPYSLIKACMDAASAVHARAAEHVATQEELKKTAEAIRPFVQTPAPTPNPSAPQSLLRGIDKDAMGYLGAGLVGGATKGLMDRALSDVPKPTSELEMGELSELQSPEHEAELRKIRAQALIAEMMDDEIIGTYEPNKVLQAYNEISQMAPQTAMQPMAMRSLMRRHLQGNMEPFESKEVTEIEKGLRATEQTPQSLIPQAPNVP
jgi:hypothetical protein